MKLKLKKNEGQRIPPKYALKITLGTDRHRIKSQSLKYILNLPLVLKVQTLFAASDSPTALNTK